MSEFMRQIEEVLNTFEADLGFTAPELWPMRVKELRGRIEAIALNHDRR